MESSVAATPTTGGGGADNTSRRGEWRGDLGWRMENPFSLKVAQVFTGFGVGCGIGIGVGRPIYLGAIPAFQQVLSATRGATDVLSVAGRHVNNSLRKVGVKGLEAGVGCGIGFGHGFGVGIAIKPSAIQRIQQCVGQALGKIVNNLGLGNSISSLQLAIPVSPEGSIYAQRGTFDKVAQPSAANPLHLTTKTTGDSRTSLETEKSLLPESRKVFDLKEASSEMPVVSHSEKVINSFPKNPALEDEKQMEIRHLAEKLISENNMLQVLLSHQRIINQLVEENEKLRQILVDDLKISPSRLETSYGNWSKSGDRCSGFFEWRQRIRRR